MLEISENKFLVLLAKHMKNNYKNKSRACEHWGILRQYLTQIEVKKKPPTPLMISEIGGPGASRVVTRKINYKVNPQCKGA